MHIENGERTTMVLNPFIYISQRTLGKGVLRLKTHSVIYICVRDCMRNLEKVSALKLDTEDGGSGRLEQRRLTLLRGFYNTRK